MFPNLLEAQTFKKISVQDGLPSSIVYDIKIDKSNRIWVATFGGGIACYDGVKFRVINEDNGLSNDLIRCIFIDEKKNKIYVGSQGAYDIITKDSITNANTILNDKIASNVLLVKMIGKTLYASTQDGLLKIENGKRTVVSPKTTIFNFFIDDDNNIWLAGKKGLSIKLKNGTIVQASELFHINIESATDVKKYGKYILVSSRKGLYVFEGLKFVRLITKTIGLENDNINCILVNGNSLWLGSKKGLIFTNDLFHFKLFGSNNGIDPCDIKCMAVDKNGLLWVGSSNNGLFKMIKSNIIKYTLPSQPYAFTTDKKNNIYALLKGSIYKLNTDSDKFIKHFILPETINLNRFCIDEANNVYLTIDEKRIAKITPLNKITYFDYVIKTKEDNNPFTVVHDSDFIWMVYKRGILKHNWRTNKTDTINLNTVNAKYYQNLIRQKQNIWFTTDKGICKIKDGTVKEYSEKNIKNFPKAIVNTIVADKYDHLWLSTDRGLVCVEQEKNIYTNYRKQGFVTNEVGDIAIIDTLLFAATNKGLVQIRIKKRLNQNCTYQLINSRNGLQDYDLTNRAIFSDSSNVWIAAETGAYRYNPSNQLKLNIPIYITNISNDSVSLVFKNTPNYTNDLVDVSQQLKLNYNENDFTIEFNGINYHLFDNAFYTYRLIGLNEKWSLPANDNKAIYTNLSPGSYEFQISLSDGKKKFGQILKYAISIRPPFYKTVWFMALLIFFGLVILYLLFQARLRAIKFKNLLLEKKVAERTLQLNNRTLQLSNSNFELTKKSKLILESLEYAKKIQESILPSQSYLNKRFKNILTTFIYLPKDIVSGDFFYSNKKEDYNYFAVVDCTGHGVPGALLSFSINSILHGIIENFQGFVFPSVIIKELLKKFAEIYIKGQDVKESFAISLIIYDAVQQKLFISAVSQSILVASKGNLYEVKNKSTFLLKAEENVFDTEVNVKSGDRVFLYSDGFYDQTNELTKKRMYKSCMVKQLESTLILDLIQQIKELETFYIKFKGNNEQIDDVTVFAIEII